MRLFKVSYENLLGEEVVVAYFLDERYLFDFMQSLLDKLNTTISVEEVTEEEL